MRSNLRRCWYKKDRSPVCMVNIKALNGNYATTKTRYRRLLVFAGIGVLIIIAIVLGVTLGKGHHHTSANKPSQSNKYSNNKHSNNKYSNNKYSNIPPSSNPSHSNYVPHQQLNHGHILVQPLHTDIMCIRTSHMCG